MTWSKEASELGSEPLSRLHISPFSLVEETNPKFADMKSILLVLVAALPLSSPLLGASLKSAEVTKVINDVRLFKPSAAAQKAKVGDVVNGKTSLQTGRRSRSELRFEDNTITRIGSNSIFSFDQGSRDLRLEQGTILLNVPRRAGGARIRTATVTAAITGTTIMMEYFAGKWVKIIVLEGTLDAWLRAAQGDEPVKTTIRAGEILILRADADRIPPPVKIDLKRLIQTSALADRQTFGPLPGVALDRIGRATAHQEMLKREGFLTTSGRVTGSNISRPGGGGRGSQPRDLVNDLVPPARGLRDPGGPPIGGGKPGEGEDD